MLDALDLIEPLGAALIAPAHGPILRDNPGAYVARYRTLSRPRLADETGDEKTLLIFYLSAYGSTARMARAIREGAEAVAGVRVSLYDLEGGEPGPFADLIEECDGLVIGSPTINADAVKPVWDLLASLAVIDTRGKLAAAFGSYGWTGEAVRMIEDRLKGLKMRVPDEGPRIKLRPTDEELDACRAFGLRLAERLAGKPQQTSVIDFAALS